MRLHPAMKLAFAAAAFAVLGTAAAQGTYPDRPIRIIVPIAAGSVTDVVLRAAGQELAPRLGQAIVIDNKPGASGIVGAEACAKAVPDGYTVCAVYHATMSFNPLTHDKLPYDPQKDLLPGGAAVLRDGGPVRAGAAAGLPPWRNCALMRAATRRH